MNLSVHPRTIKTLLVCACTLKEHDHRMHMSDKRFNSFINQGALNYFGLLGAQAGFSPVGKPFLAPLMLKFHGNLWCIPENDSRISTYVLMRESCAYLRIICDL